jgi:hypothetical protein
MGDPFKNNFDVQEGIVLSGAARSLVAVEDAATDKEDSRGIKDIASGANPLLGRSLYGIKSALGSQRVEVKNSLFAWQQTPGVAKPENTTTKDKKQLSPEETKIKDFIDVNRMSVGDGLKGIVAKHQFTLVGERHLAELDPMRKEIASSLQELKKEGLTHVGLEIPSSEKERLDKLDYSKSDDALKKEIKAPEMADVLIAAKRAGLEIVYLDKPKPTGISDEYNRELDRSTIYQNSRDEHMYNQLTGAMGEKDKALVYIGSEHVHESSLLKGNDERVYRLGSRLSQKYGDDQVASIRNVLSDEGFDGLVSSKKPSLHDVMPNHKGFMILPDDGPLKGDPRATNADYIITGK